MNVLDMESFLIVTFIVFALKGAAAEESKFLDYETQLYDKLLGNYSRLLRPVNAQNDPISVQFDLSVLYLEELNEEEQILYISGWLRLMWTDFRLKWNQTEFGNVTDMRLPVDELWIPDIYPYNSHDYAPDKDVPAIVFNNGMVFWVPPVWLGTHCSMDMRKFPYDTQKCQIKYGSWTYHGYMIDLVWMQDGQEQPEFVNDHHEFDVVSWKRERNLKYYACCKEPYIDLNLIVELKRHSSYATHLSVAPTVVVCLIMPIIFLLPPESTEKITLGGALMVSESLMLVMLVDMLPSNHPNLPDIGIYHVTNIVLIAMSLAISVLVMNIWMKGDRGGKLMPAFLKSISGVLGRVLRVHREDFIRTEARTTAVHKLEVMTEDGAHEDDRAEIMNNLATATLGAEWRQLAAVIDRLCFVIFLIVVFITTFSFSH